MKIRLFMLGAFFCSLLHFSCNDDLNLVGNGMRPGEDGISARTDTFQIKAETVLMDSVYAKSTEAALGKIFDPLYGYLESDYISQFYCEEEFSFYKSPIDGKIDSVYLNIYYYTWQGDSVASMEAQIYEVTKPLERHYYSNFDPRTYSNMQTSLGRRTYVPRDMTISNEDWYKTQDGVRTYSPHVNIKMPIEFGQKFYDESINNPETFKNQQSFNEFFPGLYITTTYGSGNILNILDTRLNIYYSALDTIVGSQNQDSVYVRSYREVFMPSREVIQLNRFENSGLKQLLNPDDNYTYLKSPAGVYTQLTIPTGEMAAIIGDRTINHIPFNIVTLPSEEWEYSFKRPNDLLLLPKDSLKVFFEEINSVSSSIAGQEVFFYGRLGGTSLTTPANLENTYPFGNIATLVQKHINENPEKDLELVIIPVNANVTRASTSATYVVPTTIENLFTATGVKIKKEELSEIQVISSEFEK